MRSAIIEALSYRPSQLDLALLFVRTVFGGTCFLHGYGKLANGVDKFAADWNLGMAPAWTAVLTQMAGGIFIVAGLGTFWAALALTVCGIVITYMQIAVAKEPFIKPGTHSWHMGLIYTLLPLLLMFTGPGAYSLDAWLARLH